MHSALAPFLFFLSLSVGLTFISFCAVCVAHALDRPGLFWVLSPVFMVLLWYGLIGLLMVWASP